MQQSEDPNSIQAFNQEIHDALPATLSTPNLNVIRFNKLMLQRIADPGPSNDDPSHTPPVLTGTATTTAYM